MSYRTSYAAVAVALAGGWTSLASVALGISIRPVPVPITPAAIAEQPVLASAQSYDLRVTLAAGEQFRFVGLYLPAAPDGSFFQHPLGGLSEPSAGAVALIPSLAFDTYLTVPPGYVLDPGVSFVGPIPSWDEQLLNRGWGIQAGGFYPGPGEITVARVTFFGSAPSGHGRFPPSGPDFTITVPEPAAGCGLAAAGTMLVRRRARRRR